MFACRHKLVSATAHCDKSVLGSWVGHRSSRNLRILHTHVIWGQVWRQIQGLPMPAFILDKSGHNGQRRTKAGRSRDSESKIFCFPVFEVGVGLWDSRICPFCSRCCCSSCGFAVDDTLGWHTELIFQGLLRFFSAFFLGKGIHFNKTSSHVKYVY